MKEFTHQIKRMTKDWYNLVEPFALATVKALNSDNTVNLLLREVALTPHNVPVLKSCYDTPTTMNLVENDTVVVAFIMGHIANPVVVGKIKGV